MVMCQLKLADFIDAQDLVYDKLRVAENLQLLNFHANSQLKSCHQSFILDLIVSSWFCQTI